MKSAVLGVELGPGEVEVLELDQRTANLDALKLFRMADFAEGKNSRAFRLLCSLNERSIGSMYGTCGIRVVKDSDHPGRGNVWMREANRSLRFWKTHYTMDCHDWA